MSDRRFIRRGVLLLALMFVFSSAWAHNSNLTYYRLEPEENRWRLSISLARATVDSALAQEHGQEAWGTADVETRKAWLADYIVGTTDLTMDGERLALGEPEVTLGGHSVRVRFPVRNAPVAATDLTARLSGFANGSNHHTVLYWDIDGHTVKAVLSDRNDYRADLNATAD